MTKMFFSYMESILSCHHQCFHQMETETKRRQTHYLQVGFKLRVSTKRMIIYFRDLRIWRWWTAVFTAACISTPISLDKFSEQSRLPCHTSVISKLLSLLIIQLDSRKRLNFLSLFPLQNNVIVVQWKLFLVTLHSKCSFPLYNLENRF